MMERQTLVVLAIVAAAIGYLSLRLLRTLGRSRKPSCSSDDCGCSH